VKYMMWLVEVSEAGVLIGGAQGYGGLAGASLSILGSNCCCT